jgi:hypothetical protein
MEIKHEPLFDTAKVEKLYSEKDGVPVKYVCTSATNMPIMLLISIIVLHRILSLAIATLVCIAILMLTAMFTLQTLI